MKRKMVIFFSALLFSITVLTELLYSQVKIKEKVEISPGARLQDKSGNQLEKFNCDEGWDYKPHKLKFYYEIVSGESNISIYTTIGCWNPSWITYSNTGVKSVSVEINNAPDGYYEFHYGVDTNIAVTIHHKYYIDDSLYTEGESTGIDVFGSFYINCCLLPTQYFRYFTLQDFHSTGNCNNPLRIEIDPDYDNNLCYKGSYLWDPNLPVNVTINDESGHIKFYNKKTKTIHGSSVLVDYLSLNSDYIIFSDLPLGANRLRSDVTFQWYDSTETRETYYFYPPGLFYLDEDQIEYLGTCSMYFDNDCYPLDLTDLEKDDLTITITQGGEYVSIISDYTQQIVGDNMIIAFDSLYYFSLVNDVVSDSNIVAIIRSEINGLIQTDTVVVTPPKIKVIVDPAELSQGDTARIILLKRYDDGTYASFPEGQLFYPDLTAGYDYASILYNGEAEDYFYEVPDSLKLRADDLGELDSVEVILRVGTYITTEIPVSALKVEEENTERISNIPPTDDEARPINNKVKKKKDGIKPKLIGGGGWDEYVEGYARVKIKKPTLYVAFNPDTLSPGDTADVIVKLKKPDGTLLPFLPEQLFEVGVIGGCEYGEILTSDGRTELYFKDIQQPIRFIAADSIDADSAIVQLRVGIPEEENSLVKRNSATASSNNYCLAVNYYYDFYGTGKGNINVSDCKVWNPKIKLDIFDRNSGAIDLGYYSSDDFNGERCHYVINFEETIDNICGSYITGNFTTHDKIGFFRPMPEVSFADFQITDCYNGSTKKYKYSVPAETFHYRVMKEICPDHTPVLIENEDDLLNKIPKEDRETALADLESQKTYGNGTKYYIKEQIEKHEYKHQLDFQEDCDNTLNEMFSASELAEYNYMSFKKVFNNYCLPQNNIAKAKEDFWKILYYLKVKIAKKHAARSNDSGYEQTTQDYSFDVLKRYIDKLNDIIKNPK